MPERVSLFLAGVQRGGTTTLFTYLSAHPELHAPRQKESHFFDNEKINWSDVNYGNLHALYDETGTPGRSFDATPITIFWPTSVPRIMTYNPDAQFILVLRDPIERAWSHWRLESSRGSENLPFAAAIREGRQRLTDLPELHPARRVYSYVERGFYASQIRRLYQYVSPQKVLFLRSADLYRDPSSTLAKIAAFAGIGPFPETPHVWLNAVPTDDDRPPSEDVAYLRDLFAQDVMDVPRLTGLDTSDWLTVRDRTDAVLENGRVPEVPYNRPS